MSKTYDLIYCEDRAEYIENKAILIETFPDATFEDASDFVHQYRFAIKRDVSIDDQYYAGLIRAGITASLGLQLTLMEKPGTITRVLELLEQEKTNERQ